MHLPNEWKLEKGRIEAEKPARLLSTLHRLEAGPQQSKQTTVQEAKRPRDTKQ